MLFSITALLALATGSMAVYYNNQPRTNNFMSRGPSNPYGRFGGQMPFFGGNQFGRFGGAGQQQPGGFGGPGPMGPGGPGGRPF